MNSKKSLEQISSLDGEKYKYGFVTNIETDRPPKGLNEDIIKFISLKKMNQHGC